MMRWLLSLSLSCLCMAHRDRDSVCVFVCALVGARACVFDMLGAALTSEGIVSAGPLRNLLSQRPGIRTES